MKITTNVENLNNYQLYLKVEETIHEFLKTRGYLKIELPVLSPALIPESYLEVFKTEFRYLNEKENLFLTPSPELFLKRLLAYGIGDCYYLGKSFRNSDPPSSLHSFEFTMLEFYKVKANYLDIADELLGLLNYICIKLNRITDTGEKTIIYGNKKISFTQWEKISVAEAFDRYAQINSNELFDEDLFFKKAESKGYNIKQSSYTDIFSQIYVQEIEPSLGQNGYPTLIYNYPKKMAALAKLNSDNQTAQRFEFYIGGIELGDCYTELTQWKEQQNRLMAESKERSQQKKIKHPIDKGFIQALQYGLTDCAGIAIGVERLAMIYANLDTISKLKLINID